MTPPRKPRICPCCGRARQVERRTYAERREYLRAWREKRKAAKMGGEPGKDGAK